MITAPVVAALQRSVMESERERLQALEHVRLLRDVVETLSESACTDGPNCDGRCLPCAAQAVLRKVDGEQ